MLLAEVDVANPMFPRWMKAKGLQLYSNSHYSLAYEYLRVCGQAHLLEAKLAFAVGLQNK